MFSAPLFVTPKIWTQTEHPSANRETKYECMLTLKKERNPGRCYCTDELWGRYTKQHQSIKNKVTFSLRFRSQMAPNGSQCHHITGGGPGRVHLPFWLLPSSSASQKPWGKQPSTTRPFHHDSCLGASQLWTEMWARTSLSFLKLWMTTILSLQRGN